MSNEYRVAIIGCGRPWKTEGSTGFGMSRAHARGLLASGRARIVALADPKQENAEAFQKDVGGEHVYPDYRVMLREEKPDVVCISTWTPLHAEMVIASAEAGAKAIHCEKPMAPTYGEAKRMVEACEKHGAVLTINHQRRFLSLFRKAKELIGAGELGTLERVEALCPNLYDWGTHWFDIMNFLNADTPVDWVLGQLEARAGHEVFGVKMEGQGLSQFRYQNGVLGLLSTGIAKGWECWVKAYGSSGRLEVSLSHDPKFKVWAKGHSDWQALDIPSEGSDIEQPVTLAMLDLLDALENRREPELSGRRALRATELIFATYESSRRRARIDLPLVIDDNPYVSMLESGMLS